MSIRRKGDTNTRIVGTRYRFDPVHGNQFVHIWEGFEQPLTLLGESFRAQGGVVDINPSQGPWYRLEAAFAAAGVTPGNEVDTWERDVEYAQEDLRNNPNIIALAGSMEQLAVWVREIKEFLDEAPLASFDPDPAGRYLIFELLSRGAEAYEITRIVLTRRRTIPIGFTAPRTPSATQYIYTTSRLVGDFAIPAEVQAILPATPASAPTNTEWSWKIRQDTSVLVPDLIKTEEVMRWSFAAWSTVLYDLLS